MRPVFHVSHGARTITRTAVRLIGTAFCVFLAVCPTSSLAQPVAEASVHGIVLLPNGKPARDVRVALLEAPKQAMTDSLGRFVLRTTYCGLATLVARRIAYVSASIDLVIPIGSWGQRQCAFVADAESIRVRGL